MNTVNLTGRLTKDPDISQTTNGGVMARFTLAVNTSRKKQDGKPESAFINCIAFGKTAELIEEYVPKGSQIGVTGEWQTGSYENQQGQRVYFNQCLVNRIDFLTPKSSQNSAPKKGYYKTQEIYQGAMDDFDDPNDYLDEFGPIDDEDLPF